MCMNKDTNWVLSKHPMNGLSLRVKAETCDYKSSWQFSLVEWILPENVCLIGREDTDLARVKTAPRARPGASGC